ncbi:MAG: ABC transporter ATP-binding protein [Betaproteobacteria bacterium]
MVDILAFENVGIEHRGSGGARSRILHDVSFAVRPGEAFGLVGESGCGKSTIALATMHALPAGMSVTAGRIVFQGSDIQRMTAGELRNMRGNRVAMIYQDPMSSLNPVMTIGQQLIEVPMVHHAMDSVRARRRAVAMLEEVRLPDAQSMMGRFPHQLSGGQQQRVVIAMALMAEPALLIMDEPTTGLDVTIEAAILELVRELRAKFGAAVLFISHNLGTVARICDRIGVLYAGRLIETGALARVFRAPAHPYTRGLLAALPRLSHGRCGRLEPIEGTIAAEDRLRIGCALSPRCAFRQPRCDGAEIPMVPVGQDVHHVARCVRLDEIPAALPRPAAPRAGGTKSDGLPVLLSVRDLSKVYRLGGRFGGKGKGAVRAVDHVSFDARAGMTLAIVGESGCGKSTLARVLSGLTPASGGEALFHNANLAALPVDERPDDLRRRIQMVFQNPDSTLNPNHSVEFALERPLRRLRGMSRSEARAEVRRLIERVRLAPDVLQCQPHQLSGGQRQRVAVARALAVNPDLLIADEPVSALDVSVQAAIVNLLSEILEQSHIALAIISHDLALVRHMADWVAVMYLGRIVEYGPADQVFAPPFHPYTDALLAAAPDPDPDAGPPRVVLGGAMPSPTQEFRGCVFASRCPRKIGAVCDEVIPLVRRFGPHTIACHLDLTTAEAV